MKKIVICLGSLASISLPLLASAAEFKTGYIDSLITGGLSIIRGLLIFLVSLAVVWFIWNVIQYTIADDEEKKGKAKEQMIWGIVGIAVIVSVWGLVAILRGMFGADSNDTAPTNLGNMIPGATTNSSFNGNSSGGSFRETLNPSINFPTSNSGQTDVFGKPL